MPGERYGRYLVRREIGRGGMGVVYLAHDPAVGRDVALKVLPAGLPGDDHVVARLRQEARLTASLDHACIVPIFDVGEQAGRPFLVMRYMPGGALDRRLQAGRLSLRAVAEILLRVAEALDAAHRQGVVHRDLKPSNILFDSRGDAYLSDFGIAKALGGSLTQSLTGTAIIGTPAYMSPEQAVGDRAIDGRSDIYALGAVAFELLTGRQPYVGDTPMRVVLRHLQDPPPQLSSEELEALGLSTAVGAALTRAMAKEPFDRFASPLELARIIASAAGLPDPTATTRPSMTAPTRPAAPVPDARPAAERATLASTRIRRSGVLAVMGLGGLTLVSLAAVWSLNRSTAASPTATATFTAQARPSQTIVVPTASLRPSDTPAPTNTTTAAPSFTNTATPTDTPTATTSPTATRRPATRPPDTATAVPPSPTSAPPPANTAPPPTNDPASPTPAPPEPEAPTPTPAPP